jgi:DNA-binding beta-propeller fold protein YncE
VTLTVRVLAGAYRGSADGTLTTARFNTPRGMTARGDEAFLADSRNHVVRRLDLGEGGVRVVAGQPGLSGWSDGPEDAARLNGPRAVAVVPGRLYIADEGNNAIRVLDLGSRVLSTLAGSPPTRGSADGVGTAATFNGPAAVVATRDGRTLYVADQYNHAVRSVDVFTREVATVAGSAGETGSADGVGPAARFNMPAALALSPGERNLYVADAYNHAIRQVDLGTRAVTTVAGLMTGPGTLDGVGRAAGFQYPSGLATDGRSLYVADRVNLRLRRVDLATWEVSTVVGKSGAQELVYGTSDVARLYPPLDVAVARERGVLLFTMDRVHAVAVVEGLPVRGVDAGAAGSPDGG